jgi:transposase
MLLTLSNIKVWLYRKPIDFRGQIDALVLLVASYLREDPTSGHVFAFRNRSADKIKLLYWEGDGFWLMYKRLEKSKFRYPDIEDTKFAISGEQLQWLLSGLDIMKIAEKKSIKVINFF